MKKNSWLSSCLSNWLILAAIALVPSTAVLAANGSKCVPGVEKQIEEVVREDLRRGPGAEAKLLDKLDRFEEDLLGFERLTLHRRALEATLLEMKRDRASRNLFLLRFLKEVTQRFSNELEIKVYLENESAASPLIRSATRQFYSVWEKVFPIKTARISLNAALMAHAYLDAPMPSRNAHRYVDFTWAAARGFQFFHEVVGNAPGSTHSTPWALADKYLESADKIAKPEPKNSDR